MNKRTILPFLILSLRVIFLVCLVAFLCLGDIRVATLMFVLAICVNACDFVFKNKFPQKRVALRIVSAIVDRAIYMVPLLFAVIGKQFTIWIYLIILFFEIIICMLHGFARPQTKLKNKLNKIFYVLYGISLCVAVFISFYLPEFILYPILVVCTLGATYIIYGATTFSEDSTAPDSEESESDNISDLEKSLHERSDSDEIIEEQ